MTDADLSAPRPFRFGVAVLVAFLHLAAFIGLIRAFSPGTITQAVDSVVATFTVTVTAPSPTPPPEPKSGQAAGAAGEAGKRATPREVMAPRPKLIISRQQVAPAAASNGIANSSGALETGAGTGAGGEGNGTGSGGAGNGQGGGGGTKVAKIAGDINSAKDYPIATRDQRINDYVVVWLTVGTDGRPTACKVARPSKDDQANAITCKLALERFRFKPATGPDGQPVKSTYGWRQRWFYKD